MTGHEGGQGGGASPGDLKLSGVTLGAKEKVGGDRVENQEVGAESLQGGGGALRGAAGGPVLVVVVVVAAVVDAIVDGCCDRTVVKVLYCSVGVTRGAQGSRSSLCGLPGPSGSITTDVLWRSSYWAGSSSVSVSRSSSLPVFSSTGSTCRLVACTLGRKGPRKGAFMSLVL